MDKYYINITNKCDYKCPFCCMYSSPDKNSFMSFDILYNIIEKLERPTVIQLEGGEPLLHPNIILFLEYLASKELVSKIVIDTNAKHIDSLIDVIVGIAERNKKPITIKPSYNTFLKSMDQDLLKRLKLVISACEFLEYVDFEVNVRAYDKDELDGLCTEIGKYPHNAFLFNRYGRAVDDTNLVEPYITKTFDNWQLISSDGMFFGNDLIERSKYEQNL
jgi:MoaA/NifB/PqqE/SkfB family radical SAM enzyme